MKKLYLTMCVSAGLLGGQLSGKCSDASTIFNAFSQGFKIANEQQQQDDANAAAQQAANDAAQQAQAQADAIAAQQRAMVNQQAFASGAYLFNDAQYGDMLLVTCNDGPFQAPCQFDASRFTNIKTTYSSREKVTFVITATTALSGWHFKIFDSNGLVIRNAAPDGSSWGRKWWFSPTDPGPLNPGTYTFGLYIGDTLLKKIGFTITGDAQESRQPQPAAAELPKGACELTDNECGHAHIVTCNYYQNFEGDHIAHFPQDFVGVKNYFSTKEQIQIQFSTSVLQSGYGMKMWDENGGLVNSYVSTNESKGIKCVFRPGTPNALKSGSYTVGLYHNDHFIKKISFVVGE